MVKNEESVCNQQTAQRAQLDGFRAAAHKAV